MRARADRHKCAHTTSQRELASLWAQSAIQLSLSLSLSLCLSVAPSRVSACAREKANHLRLYCNSGSQQLSKRENRRAAKRLYGLDNNNNNNFNIFNTNTHTNTHITNVPSNNDKSRNDYAPASATRAARCTMSKLVGAGGKRAIQLAPMCIGFRSWRPAESAAAGQTAGWLDQLGA